MNYTAFGLTIASDIPLSALSQRQLLSEPDLTIRFGDDLRKRQLAARIADEDWQCSCPIPDSSVRFCRRRDGGAFHIEYEDHTWFCVDCASWQLEAGWRAAYTEDDMATYLLGPIIGFVLRLKGIVCVHASVVNIAGNAVLFVGSAGAGKSTISATLGLLRIPVMSDDIAALDPGDGAIWLRPGYPRLRLWPDAANALFGNADELPQVSPSWDKRHLNLLRHGYSFHDRAAKLGSIFVLSPPSEGDTVLPFVRISPANAIISLAANGYVSYLLDRSMIAHEFDTLSRVAALVPVWRAQPPRDLRKLPDYCERILAHLGREA